MWGYRQDGLGDLPGLWPPLSCARLGQGTSKKALFLVASGQSGGGRSPGRLDDLSLPTGSQDSTV
jgi:hypothetical protein